MKWMHTKIGSSPFLAFLNSLHRPFVCQIVSSQRLYPPVWFQRCVDLLLGSDLVQPFSQSVPAVSGGRQERTWIQSPISLLCVSDFGRKVKYWPAEPGIQTTAALCWPCPGLILSIMLRSSFFPCPLPPLYIKVLSLVGIFQCWRVRRDVRGHRNFKDSPITVGRNSMSTIKVIWEPVGWLQFLRSLHERIHIMNYLSSSQPMKVFSPWRLLYGGDSHCFDACAICIYMI